MGDMIYVFWITTKGDNLVNSYRGTGKTFTDCMEMAVNHFIQVTNCSKVNVLIVEVDKLDHH